MSCIRCFTAASLFALVLGCGATNGKGPAYGDLSVHYSFQGLEAPQRVTVYVIDAATFNLTCAGDGLAAFPEDSVLEEKRNLPIEGTADFKDLPKASGLIVRAFGSNLGGVQVATACKSSIKVEGGKTREVNLLLENEPLRMQGDFAGSTELDFQVPPQLTNILVAFDVACEATGMSEDTCAISNGIANLLSDLDVTLEWQINQNGPFVRGDMVWTEIEGVPVGPQWDLVQGGFTAEIPGATQLVIKTNDMKINLDQLVLFLVDEVMGFDLEQYGAQVELLVDALASDMTINEGEGTLVDQNFDAEADQFYGTMDAEIDFQAFSYVHELQIDWTSYRIGG